MELRRIKRRALGAFATAVLALTATAADAATFRDSFLSQTYTANDGNTNFGGSWVETNDDNSPSAGSIFITTDDIGASVLQLNSSAGDTLHRPVDLSTYASATIDINYRRNGFDADDYVAIEVSDNNGGSYTEVGRITGAGSDAAHTFVQYDISAFLTAGFRVRLNSFTNNPLWLDNIQITTANVANTNGHCGGRADVWCDDFNEGETGSGSYGNNDGGNLFSGDWIEFNESDGAGTGDVRIATDAVLNPSVRSLQVFDDNRGLYRYFDGTGYDQLLLRVRFRKVSLDDSSEGVNVQVGQNTSISATLAFLEGPSNQSSYSTGTLDITQYADDNMFVLLRSPSGTMDGAEGVLFDWIEIEGVTLAATATVQGRLFHDVNGNGTYEAGTDLPISGVRVFNESGSGEDTTDFNGLYSIPIQSGTRTIRVDLQDPNFSLDYYPDEITDAEHSQNFPTGTTSGIDFPMNFSFPNPDLDGVSCIAEQYGVLVLDASDSIDAEQQTLVREGTLAYLQTLVGRNARVALTQFGLVGDTILPFTLVTAASITNVFTPALNNQYHDGNVVGWTNWEAGLKEMNDLIAGSGQQVDYIVFLTDGQPNHYLDANGNPVGPIGNLPGEDPGVGVRGAHPEATVLKQSGVHFYGFFIGNGTDNVQTIRSVSSSVVDSLEFVPPEFNINQADWLQAANFDEFLEKLIIFGDQVCRGDNTNLLNGTVFEDVNGDSDRSDQRPIVGAKVSLYRDIDGDGVVNNFDFFVEDTLTGNTGAYVFDQLIPGNYITVVDSRTLNPPGGYNGGFDIGDAWAEQVYGPEGAFCDGGTGTQTIRTSNGPCYGGRTAGVSDDVAAGVFQHASTVELVQDQAITQHDFGFSWNVVTHVDGLDNRDDDLTSNRGVQGSLRQFADNSNAYLGENHMRFVPTVPATNTSANGEWWQFPIVTAITPFADTQTTIDGRAWQFTDGTVRRNAHSGQIGVGGVVGTGADGREATGDEPALSTVPRPELEIVDANALRMGLYLTGTQHTIRDLAIYGFGEFANRQGTDANIEVGPFANNATIIRNIIGSSGDEFADPGAGNRSLADNIVVQGGDNGLIQNNLIGYSAGSGARLASGATGWLIDNNEVRSNALENGHLDGVNISQAGTINNIVSGNLIVDSGGNGIDSFANDGANTVIDNTVTNSGQIIPGPNARETPGIRVFGDGWNVEHNVVANNYGAGIMVAGGDNHTLTQNSIYDNGEGTDSAGSAASGQIGIDLLSAADNADVGTPGFVTINDSGDSDGGANDLLNFPVIESATIDASGDLTVAGFVGPGSIVEIFIADPDPSSFGEGRTYIITQTEGSGDDGDVTTGSYSGPVNGIEQGSDTTNRFSFTFPRDIVSGGTLLTATATNSFGATSEFSGIVEVQSLIPGISGTVFEDANYGGGSGRNLADSAGVLVPGARVELYDSNGNFISATVTDGNGDYRFDTAAGDYFVRVVNSTVASQRPSTGAGITEFGVQTFRTDASTFSLQDVTGKVGGEAPADSDAGANTSGLTLTQLASATGVSVQSVTPVQSDGINDRENINFGYNFDTIVNTNPDGQGSLAQFILNSNELANTGLAQVGLEAGREHSIFMIPPPGDTLGRPADSGWDGRQFVISSGTGLPIITDSFTAITGATQTNYSGDTELAVAEITTGPEIRLGLSSATDGATAIHTTGSDFLLEGLQVSNPNGSTDALGSAVRIEAANAVIRNNTLNDNGTHGISVSAAGDNALIEDNVIRGSTGQPGANGISLQGPTTVSVLRNDIIDNGGIGLDISGAASGILVDANTISRNGADGIRATTTAATLNVTISDNTLHDNGGAGVLVNGSYNDVTITQNSFSDNGGLGIDLNAVNQAVGDGVTVNDVGDADSGSNDLLNFPVFDMVLIDGGQIEVSGIVPTGATMEFYIADPDPTGFGEGITYLGDYVEGAANDLDSGVGSYKDKVVGEDQDQSRFRFFVPRPAGFNEGDRLTAIAIDAAGNTSEFSFAVASTQILPPLAPSETFCYLAADDGPGSNDDHLTRIEKDGSGETYIGAMGTTLVENLANQPGSQIIYAVNGGTLGTVNRSSGVFSAIGTIGSANGALGSINISDIDGLMFDGRDLSGQTLYATHRRSSPNPDLLLQIDVNTGGVVPGAFNGDDYLVLETVTDQGAQLPDVDDMTFDPTEGQFYVIANNGGSSDHLARINPETGGVFVLGPMSGGSDIEGLSVDYDGNMFATSGGGRQFFSVDKRTGVLTLISNLGVGLAGSPGTLGDYEGISCLISPLVDVDVEVTKTVDNPSPNEGELINYTISLLNRGPDTVIDLAVREALPDGLFLNSATPSLGSYDENTNLWSVTTVGVNQTVTLTLEVIVGAGTAGQTLINNAELIGASGQDVDSVPNNNEPTEDDQDSATITVQARPPITQFPDVGSCWLYSGDSASGSGDNVTRIDGGGPSSSELFIGAAGTPDGATIVSQRNTGRILMAGGAFVYELATDGSATLLGTPGTGNGAEGSVPLNNIVALAFDPADDSGQRLYAVHRSNPASPDLLFQIDPNTGQLVAGAFFGDDYLVIDPITPETMELADVGGLAVDPTDGSFYVAMNNDGAGDYLLAHDPFSGVTTVVGKLGREDTRDLSFTNSGQLVAVGGGTSSAYYTIDKNTAMIGDVFAVGSPVVGLPPADEPLTNYLGVDCGILAPADFSDAPVTFGEPSHRIVSGVYLGAADPDADVGGLPTADASGDDLDATDDEDATDFAALTFKLGSSTDVSFAVSGAGGYLQAWVDWNADGSFGAGEQVITDLQDADNDGSVTASIAVPETATVGDVIVRLRWSRISGINAVTADIGDGEVEDHVLTVQPDRFEGVVFVDADSSSSFSIPEIGIADVEVVLYDDDNGQCIGLATTDAGGGYDFIGAPPGNYQVIEAEGALLSLDNTIGDNTPVACSPANLANDPAGFSSTTPNIQLITINPDGSISNRASPSLWPATLTSVDFGEIDTSPFAGCDAAYQTTGFSGDIQLNQLDVVTGQLALYPPGNPVNYANVNAIGYNRVDDHIYVFNTDPAAYGFGRIDINGNWTQFTATADAITENANAGSINDNGYWVLAGRNISNVYVVDVDARRSSFLQIVNTLTLPTNLDAADIAWNPVDNEFYTVQNTTGDLFRLDFNGAPETATSVSRVLVGSSTFELGTGPSGAQYFDDAGNMYFQHNNSGIIYRLENVAGIAGGANITAVEISTGAVVTQNDGAGCVPEFGTDFSDAPASYPVANHNSSNISNGQLGALRDFEGSALTSENADGDDVDNSDDDDGVTLGGNDLQGQAIAEGNANLTITASQAGFLSAWVDFNGDGDFDDANEQVAENIAVVAGANTLTINPALADFADFSGNSFARFRYTEQDHSGLTAGGAVLSGEVEDYQIVIDPRPTYIGLAKQAEVNDEDVTITLRVKGHGPIDLTSVQIIENLDGTFGAGNYSVATPTLTNSVEGTTALTLNGDWDGTDANDNLLDGTGTIDAGGVATISFAVTIINITDQGNGVGNFVNQAQATALRADLDPADPAAALSDLSDNGISDDDDGNGNPTEQDAACPVYGAAGFPDDDGTDEQNCDNDPTPIMGNIDIELTKTVSDPAPVEGGAFSYTLEIINNGPETAGSVVVRDVLPMGIRPVGATASVGSFDVASFTWSIPTLAANSPQTLVIQVVADVGTAGATIINTAEVIAHNNLDIDSVPGNQDPAEDDQSSVPVTVQTLPPPNVPDANTCYFLAGESNSGSGDHLTTSPANVEAYFLDVGTVDATGVSTQPGSGVQFLSFPASLMQINPATGSAVSVGAAGTASGAEGNIAINNIVEIAFDPYDANGEILYAVHRRDGAADILVRLDPATGNVISGAFSNADYVVLNGQLAGFDNINAIAIDPADRTFYAIVGGAGNDRLVSLDSFSGAVNNDLGDLGFSNTTGMSFPNSGTTALVTTGGAGSQAYSVTPASFSVGSGEALGSGVLGIPPGLDPLSDYQGVSCGLPPVDIAVTKTVSPASVGQNQAITWTVTVTNQSSTVAGGLVIEDRLGAGLTFDSASPNKGVYDSASDRWFVDYLASGETATLQLTSTSPADASGQMVENVAELISLHAFDTDSTPDNNLPDEDDQDSAEVAMGMLEPAPVCDGAKFSVVDWERIPATLGTTQSDTQFGITSTVTVTELAGGANAAVWSDSNVSYAAEYGVNPLREYSGADIVIQFDRPLNQLSFYYTDIDTLGEIGTIAGSLNGVAVTPGVTVGPQAVGMTIIVNPDRSVTVQDDASDGSADVSDEQRAVVVGFNSPVDQITISSASTGADTQILGDIQLCADFSDAPLPTQTALHIGAQAANVYLGAVVDSDAGPYTDADANGDGADDDGVLLGGNNLQDQTLVFGNSNSVTLAITTVGAGTLYSYFDFNADGDFDDAGEALPPVVSGGGAISQTVNLPDDLNVGPTFARFRYSNSDEPNASSPVGAVNAGEVEDYRIFLESAGVSVSGRVYHDIDHDGSRDSAENWVDGTPVFVNLVDNDTGVVVASSPVNPGAGDYLFEAVVAGNYSLVVTDSDTNSSPVPPTGWLPINPTPPSRSITVADQPINNQNFGLFHGSRLSGNVIADTGVGSGSANDAVQNGAEPGIGNVTISATDAGGGLVYATTQTTGDGSYVLWLSHDANNQTVVIRETNPSGFISTGGDGGDSGGSYSLADDAVSYLNVSGSTYSDIDFFDVPGNSFTPDGEKTTRPGGVVFYGHQFDAGTGGTVNFTFAESNSPASTGWGRSLFLDPNCNGELDAGESPLAEGADVPVGAEEDLCIVVKVQAPSTAVSGAQQLLSVAANLSYANSALTGTLTRTDLTRVGEDDAAGLVLNKTVDQLRALPGEILTYTVAYRNSSARNLTEIEVNDSVPSFTTFVDASCPADLPQSLTGCQVITQPAPGGTGPLLWQLDGVLAPGAEGAVTFRVRIDQ